LTIWKHFEQRILTLDGITIDSSDESENADDSIRVNREFDSNEIDENDLQHEKQNEQGISIWLGSWTIDGVEKFRINLW
jgi:hypothetical protein